MGTVNLAFHITGATWTWWAAGILAAVAFVYACRRLSPAKSLNMAERDALSVARNAATCYLNATGIPMAQARRTARRIIPDITGQGGLDAAGPSAP